MNEFISTYGGKPQMLHSRTQKCNYATTGTNKYEKLSIQLTVRG